MCQKLLKSGRMNARLSMHASNGQLCNVIDGEHHRGSRRSATQTVTAVLAAAPEATPFGTEIGVLTPLSEYDQGDR